MVCSASALLAPPALHRGAPALGCAGVPALTRRALLPAVFAAAACPTVVSASADELETHGTGSYKVSYGAPKGWPISEQELQGHSIENIINGVYQVSTPATFGVLTTIVAFAPTLFVDGMMGPFPRACGWVVILCLIFSLIESK